MTDSQGSAEQRADHSGSGTERFEKTTRREIYRCSECDEFELEKKFSGAAGTPGEEEYNRIEAPDQCPVCGGEIEREVVA